jgi:hypothetical protein
MSKEDKESFSVGRLLEPTFFHEYGVNGTRILGKVWGMLFRLSESLPID